jgi:hypothetical protein
MKKSTKKLLLLLSILGFTVSNHAQTRVFDPFQGFHFGYTGQIGITKPVEIIPLVTNFEIPDSKSGLSWQYGVEASYHFAKYFGVSLGLNLGTGMVMNVDYKIPNISEENNFSDHLLNMSIPVKFETHVPVSPNFWFYSDLGVRLTATSIGLEMSPFFDRYWSNNWIEVYVEDDLGNSELNYEMEYNYEPNIIKTDLLLDFGFYYKLPYADLIRVGIGANIGLNRITEGYYNYPTLNTFGTIISHDTHFDFQLSYIHNFKRAKEKLYSKPNWNQNFSKHELMLSIGDSYLINIWNTFSNFPFYYPTFSFSYHYRLAKWFWLGCSVNYSHLYNSEWGGTNEEYLSFIANLRFSYLNRKNITLYSGIGIGLGGGYYPYVFRITSSGLVPYNNYFTTIQITALGVKVGGNKWFGDLELGVGYKGFVSLGAGYNL